MEKSKMTIKNPFKGKGDLQLRGRDNVTNKHNRILAAYIKLKNEYDQKQSNNLNGIQDTKDQCD